MIKKLKSISNKNLIQSLLLICFRNMRILISSLFPILIFRKKENSILKMPKRLVVEICSMIFIKTARPHLIQPTFVTDWYPVISSRWQIPMEMERQVYQLLIAGWETVKCLWRTHWSHYPKKTLEDQQKAKCRRWRSNGSRWSFSQGNGIGFPPMTGNGFGVDRLCALLTGMPNLRDVVLFPTLKPDYREKKNFQKETKVAVAFLNSSANLEAWQKWIPWRIFLLHLRLYSSWKRAFPIWYGGKRWWEK